MIDEIAWLVRLRDWWGCVTDKIAWPTCWWKRAQKTGNGMYMTSTRNNIRTSSTSFCCKEKNQLWETDKCDHVTDHILPHKCQGRCPASELCWVVRYQIFYFQERAINRYKDNCIWYSGIFVTHACITKQLQRWILRMRNRTWHRVTSNLTPTTLNTLMNTLPEGSFIVYIRLPAMNATKKNQRRNVVN